MTKAFLEITMKISPEQQPQAGSVYTKDRQPFLSSIPGAKYLLLRAEDVQVLHGFDSKANAESYLGSELFQKDVVTALKPLPLGRLLKKPRHCGASRGGEVAPYASGITRTTNFGFSAG
jgi:hypothetical protein